MHVNCNMNYKVVSLFSGVGGFGFGFGHKPIVHFKSIKNESIIESYNHKNGFVTLKPLPFDIVFQNDIIPNCKLVCQSNNMDSNYKIVDIRHLIEQQYSFPKADVVIGGFPCQDFQIAVNGKD